MNRITYILTLIIALISGLGSYGQTPYVIDEVCAGADRHYRVDGEAGSTYVWKLTDPLGNVTVLPETGDAVNILWNVAPGEYSLSTVQHNPATGCDGLLELGTITVHGFVIDYIASNTTCGQSNGSIDVNVAGGSGTYEYMLEGLTAWQSGDVFSDLAAGPYTLKVRDNYGCELTYNEPIEIQATATVDITDVEIQQHSVNGIPNGIVKINAVSPAMPIRYSLDKTNWQASPVYNGLASGDYMAYAIDDNGCIDSLNFTIGNVVLGKIELESGRITGCVNDIRLLDVVVYDFDSIMSFTLQLTYDNTILDFLGLGTVNPALLSGTTTAVETAPGTLEISYSGPNEVSVSQGGLLLQLTMQGKASGSTGLNWDWLKCMVNSPWGYLNPPTAVVNNFAQVYSNPDLVAYRDSVFCAGDSTTLYAVANMDQITYEWTHPRGIKHYGDTWNLGTLSVLDSGEYIVEAKHDQCYSIDTVHIVVNPAPKVYISYSDTVCFGNPVVLDPGTDFEYYQWSNGSTMPSIIAYEAGVYWVSVVDINGCRAVDSVELVPCVLDVLIPNAFTPNGDGLNDDFKPLFSGFEPVQYRMDIYNKWGELIFTTNDTGEGWDGTVDGSLVDPNTFVYVISFEAPSYVMRQGLKSPITGRVSVIR